MTFADLANGSSVFLDSNTFIYHFTPDPSLGTFCSDLLIRIRRGEIDGCTSTHVLSEVAHRLMAIEAVHLHGWPVAKIARRLRSHPAEVQQLTNFRKALQEVPNLGVRVLLIPADLVEKAAAVSQRTGLLSNDALIVAVMEAHSLTNLASHDSDFDRVPGLKRYAPA